MIHRWQQLGRVRKLESPASYPLYHLVSISSVGLLLGSCKTDGMVTLFSLLLWLNQADCTVGIFGTLDLRNLELDRLQVSAVDTLCRRKRLEDKQRSSERQSTPLCAPVRSNHLQYPSNEGVSATSSSPQST